MPFIIRRESRSGYTFITDIRQRFSAPNHISMNRNSIAVTVFVVNTNGFFAQLTSATTVIGNVTSFLRCLLQSHESEMVKLHCFSIENLRVSQPLYLGQDLIMLFYAQLCFQRYRLFLCPLLFKAQHEALDFFSVSCSTENFQRIILQGFNPGFNIGDMLRRVMTYSQLIAHDHAGNFCAKFLFGVTFTTKRMGQITIKA
ncbi:Uncharacterised protein [Enterobacter hormaechei]|nr:Uncharacterised protein [Enterobacter hormaechei]